MYTIVNSEYSNISSMVGCVSDSKTKPRITKTQQMHKLYVKFNIRFLNVDIHVFDDLFITSLSMNIKMKENTFS